MVDNNKKHSEQKEEKNDLIHTQQKKKKRNQHQTNTQKHHIPTPQKTENTINIGIKKSYPRIHTAIIIIVFYKLKE